MKAVVLKSFDSPLSIETLSDPVLGTGEVIVDMASAVVLSYAKDVQSGARKNLLNLPAVLGSGGVGRVRAIGPDATRLAIGDWVFCDPTVRSRDDALTPDVTLQGWAAGGPGGLLLQNHFRHGAWAERMMLPTENAIRIGSIDAADAPKWCAMGILLVPYGGLLAADLRAGETVIVNGATGAFGSAGAAIAIAMGAGRVIATGRSQSALATLSQKLGPRLRAVCMTGDEEVDRGRILDAAHGPIDCVLDLLPPMANSSQVRTAAMTVRPHGRVILMGGVGQDGGGLELPYRWIMRNGVTIRGQWMVTLDTPQRIVGLIRSGLLSLDLFDVTVFGLDDVADAVAHSAANAGPLRMTVIRPRG